MSLDHTDLPRERSAALGEADDVDPGSERLPFAQVDDSGPRARVGDRSSGHAAAADIEQLDRSRFTVCERERNEKVTSGWIRARGGQRKGRRKRDVDPDFSEELIKVAALNAEPITIALSGLDAGVFEAYPAAPIGGQLCERDPVAIGTRSLNGDGVSRDTRPRRLPDSRFPKRDERRPRCAPRAWPCGSAGPINHPQATSAASAARGPRH